MTHDTPEPSGWIRRHAALFAPGAHVLDVAAGRGRHARLLASFGHDVLAVDRDAEALSALAGVGRVRTLVVDLESGPWPLAGRRFDAIVVANYLHRPTFDAMLACLEDDGVLVYETFAEGNAAFGRPSNPAFLLREGELLERVRGRLAVAAYEEGLVERGEGRAVVQRLAAVGPGRARPWRLP